ncbi:hypothetical protein SEUCBS139899_009002 [Sporothrix eucalyptigena]
MTAGSRDRPDQQSPATSQATKTKPPKVKKTTKEGRPLTTSPKADPPKRKAGRPRKSDTSLPPASPEAPVEAEEPPARTKGRKAARSKKTAEDAVDLEATSSGSKPKEKRRRKGNQQEEDAQTRNEAEEEAKRQAEEGRESGPEEDAEEEGASSQRRQSSGIPASQANPPFRQLVPRTRLIPMATMVNKWAPLERDAIAAVQDLLEECARPVMSRVRASRAGGGGGAANERLQDQTRQAITSVTRRLRSKLVKGIPFPPGTVFVSSRKGRRSTKGQGDKPSSGLEADFNYERAVEGAQALEQQLTPLQHAIALLERERKREEEALEADYATLRELETNAQADLRTWRERSRKAHVLAPVDGGTGNRSDRSNKHLLQVELVEQALASDENGKDENDQQSGGVFENLNKDLSTAATQLNNHMDSMKANLQQIDGVVPAIIMSKAALQHVLHQRLDPLQYERILLGQ